MKSPKAARLAVNKGYTNVYLYQEGMSAWGKAGYSFETAEAIPRMRMNLMRPDEVDDAIKSDPGIVVVDIRDSDLFSSMRFPYKNTVNLPFTYLDERRDEITMNTRIIVACHAGKQCLQAGPYLKGKGYNVIGCLEGGIMAWQKAGKPIER